MSKQKANGGMAPSKKLSTDRRWPIVAAVVAVVVAVAGGGFWVWHEQPSFCNAICHTPMDPYVAAFDQQPGTAGVDKWGNEVSNTSSMLAVVHAASKDEGGADANCLSCHKPTIAQQLTEVSEWSTGNMPLFANEGVRAGAWRARHRAAWRVKQPGRRRVLPERGVPQHNPPRPGEEDGALWRAQSAHGHARPAARLRRLPQGAPRFGERVQPVPRGCSHPRWLADIRPSAGETAQRIGCV